MYHIGLEVLYVIGFLVIKERFYLEPQFSTLLLKNQEILMFKSGSVISMAIWKMHLEARTLVLVWMDMTPSFVMMNRVLLRVTPAGGGYQGPPDSPGIDDIGIVCMSDPVPDSNKLSMMKPSAIIVWKVM